MSYAVICAVALVASLLTLFSGFGLGTLLLPAFAAFFPLPLAIAMTAVVHFLNNLFKLALLGKHANWPVVVRFAPAAIVGALLGALALTRLDDLRPIARFELGGRAGTVTWVKLVIGLLIIAFGVLEARPERDRVTFSRRWLPLGGLVSGFFGGLSGHQGALRSAFLIRAGLSARAFIATGVVIACFVDLTRLGVYGSHATAEGLGDQWPVVAAATAAAFVGAFAGARLMKKTTLPTVRAVVGLSLVFFGAAMALGLV